MPRGSEGPRPCPHAGLVGHLAVSEGRVTMICDFKKRIDLQPRRRKAISRSMARKCASAMAVAVALSSEYLVVTHSWKRTRQCAGSGWFSVLLSRQRVEYSLCLSSLCSSECSLTLPPNGGKMATSENLERRMMYCETKPETDSWPVGIWGPDSSVLSNEPRKRS